jgi:hypothetical protein
MRAATFAAVIAACGLVPIAVGPSRAAEPCPGAVSVNNPAFGAPRTCAPAKVKPGSLAKSSKSAPTTDRKADAVKSGNGETTYRYGDTTIAVGGYVQVDMATGRGKMRP